MTLCIFASSAMGALKPTPGGRAMAIVMAEAA